MTAGWVAAATRGRALLDGLVGIDGARALVASTTWPEAATKLGTTFYGRELDVPADRETARRTAAAATAWQLRVLAGWVPPGASGLARLFAGPLEIANIEQHLAGLAGAASGTAIPLGSLSVAWPRVALTTSTAQVRDALARSAWGDPGGTDPTTIGVGLRVAWARRVVRQVPDAAAWARGGTAVLVAREKLAFGRELAHPTDHEVDKLIGTRWRQAPTVADLSERLPRSAAWALAPAGSPSELWLAEVAVVRRIGEEATQLAGSGRYTQSTVMAMMALLLVDLWRVTAAIEATGRDASEVFDEVA